MTEPRDEQRARLAQLVSKLNGYAKAEHDAHLGALQRGEVELSVYRQGKSFGFSEAANIVAELDAVLAAAPPDKLGQENARLRAQLQSLVYGVRVLVRQRDDLRAAAPPEGGEASTQAIYHDIPREQDGPIRIVLEMRSAAHHDRTKDACTRSALAGWADRLSDWLSRN